MKAISARSVAAQAACLILFACAQSIKAETFDATVTGVIDGDTIEVLHNGTPERIRLSQIDCPEKSQAYGTRAKEATSSLVFGKHVQVDSHGHDRYGRTIADIHTDDGTDLNKKLVELGLAWQYLRYSQSKDLAGEESNARSSHRGLWADNDPVPPWQYRQARRALRYSHSRYGSRTWR